MASRILAGMTSKRVLSRFLKVPQSSDAVMLEYIWIDGTGEGVRSKCKTMSREPQKPQGVCGWVSLCVCSLVDYNSQLKRSN